MKVNSTIELNNHTKIPALGLGVWQIEDGHDTEQAVTWALEAGYRHIDTAKIYHNERGVGDAIRRSKLNRDQIWVTTKLWPTDIIRAQRALEESLQRLGLEYVDLYLIHWPVPGIEARAWKNMENLYEQGLAKAIGVSNYSVGQLQKVLDSAQVPPAVNQVKCSPFTYDQKLHEFCKANEVAFEAYSPLTRGRNFDDPVLNKIANKHRKSPAQVLIRWALQHGMVVIPKSANHDRIKENADVYDFELTDQDMHDLNGLS